MVGGGWHARKGRNKSKGKERRGRSDKGGGPGVCLDVGEGEKEGAGREENGDEKMKKNTEENICR